jgi:hypothetical protein
MVKRINLLNFLSLPSAEGVTANVRGKMSTRDTAKGVFLHVDSLLLDLNIKKPRLSVAKIFNNNRILSEFAAVFRSSTRCSKFSLNIYSRSHKSVPERERTRNPESHATATAEKAEC